MRLDEHTPNYINHVGFVVDMSQSMGRHAAGLIKAVDAEVAHLALRSTELDQETRVTLYTFNYTATCVFYDKDVLRLPSLAGHYHPSGRTALRDAFGRAINDMKMTATLYGDHAFLLYGWTDGWENESHLVSQRALATQINGLPDNWTVAGLGPNAQSVHEMKGLGIPAGNVNVWNTLSDTGVEEAGVQVRSATEGFMLGRAKGVRGTRDLFSTGIEAVNALTIKEAGLGALARNSYVVLDVPRVMDIRPFVEGNGHRYYVGNAYYLLSKRETITPTKRVAIRSKRTGEVFMGDHARELLGLKGDTVRVTPADNPAYEVFIQSKSVNRKLVAGTKVLYIKAR